MSNTRTLRFLPLLLLLFHPLRQATAQLVEVIEVKAVNTSPVYSQPLLANVDYELTCKGTFSFWRDAKNDSVGLVDPAYYIDVPEGEFGNGLEPFPTTLTNGLLINDRTVTAHIGLVGVNAAHTYVVPFRGSGSPVKLFIEDHPPFGVDRHPDNTGSVIVEIRRISPAASVTPMRIDFGDVLLGSSRDSTIRFRNIARSSLLVTLSSIAGQHAADFSVLGSGSFLLYENQDSTVGVRFNPAGVGKRFGALLFNTNDPAQPQVRIDLEGNGIAPTISISPSLIDFGEVELGAFKDTLVTVRNTGTAPLTVQRLTLAGTHPGEFTFVPPSTFVVPSGQSRSVTLRFAPTTIRSKEADLLITSNAGGSNTTTVRLTGLGVTTLTAGFSDGHRGRAEQIVRIPVELFENRSGSDATSFNFLAKYNYRILYPRGVSGDGTLSQSFSLSSNSPRPGVLRIEGINGQPLQGTGVLVRLEFLVLFGDTTSSPLIIDSLRFNDGNPRARMRNALFGLDSACNQFLRQVTEVGVSRLWQNMPNPSNPSTIIPFSIPVPQHVRLEIRDAVGRLIATPVDEWRKEGEYRVEFIPPASATGIYFYTLRTMDGIQTRKMVVMR